MVEISQFHSRGEEPKQFEVLQMSITVEKSRIFAMAVLYAYDLVKNTPAENL